MSSNDESINTSIDDFFAIYFKKEYAHIDHHEKIRTDYTVSPYPTMDFIFLFKFIRIEIDHLKGLGPHIIDDELRKIFKYTVLSVKTLVAFKKSQLSAHVVYKNNFSLFNQEIKEINQTLQNAISKKDISLTTSAKIKDQLDFLDKDSQDYKILNKKFADTVQNIALSRDIIATSIEEQKDFDKKVFPRFLDKNKENIEYIYSALLEQLGFFTFLTNQKLWENAHQNTQITNYFKKINLHDDASIITYMDYHLKNQTSGEDIGKNQILFRKKLESAIKTLTDFYNKGGLY